MMFEHLALMTKNLEKMKDFYTTYFGGKAKKWISPDETGIIYYIKFENGVIIEIEQKLDGDSKIDHEKGSRIGIDHFAFQVENREAVRTLTQKLKDDGFEIVVEPTDYGCENFYESCVKDPDGNLVEIVIDAKIFDD